ncbi:MAG: methylenetetrahydrofolate reductase [Gammaproteobacteria bacterium]|jgi:methylenetetrahydrofolate reductase (NADPH)|nr:methylenetetrahydrofolate reductase [Gammaproteobacteria bacterium]
MQFSFEFFPPRSSAGQSSLHSAIQQLQIWQPSFASMTYGAGGTSQQESFAGTQQLVAQELNTAAHITCVGADRASVQATAKQFVAQGVEHLVALRGDSPVGAYVPHKQGYAFANDLVAGLREWFAGTISVAAYPEVHPQAASGAKDLDFLKAKVDAGADQIISQYCYDTDTLLAFAERLQQADIKQPFLVGIMPIHDIVAVQRFSARCGASVPKAIVERFAGLEQPADIAKLSIDIAAEQCRLLLENGLDQFHFYTLNRSALTAGVLASIQGPAVNLAMTA